MKSTITVFAVMALLSGMVAAGGRVNSQYDVA